MTLGQFLEDIGLQHKNTAARNVRLMPVSSPHLDAGRQVPE